MTAARPALPPLQLSDRSVRLPDRFAPELRIDLPQTPKECRTIRSHLHIPPVIELTLGDNVGRILVGLTSYRKTTLVVPCGMLSSARLVTASSSAPPLTVTVTPPGPKLRPIPMPRLRAAHSSLRLWEVSGPGCSTPLKRTDAPFETAVRRSVCRSCATC